MMHKNSPKATYKTAKLADFGQHYAEQGLTSKAFRFYRMAGDSAVAEYAYADAADYYSEALSLAPDLNGRERFKMIYARERLLGLLGRPDAQLQDLKSLEALAEQFNSDLLRVKVGVRQAKFHETKGELDTALTIAGFVTRLAHFIDEAALQGEAVMVKGRAQTRIGNYELAEQLLVEALALAQRGNDRHLQAHIYQAQGKLNNLRTDFAAAAQAYQQALALFGEHGDKLGRSHTLNNLGHVEQMQGHLQAALDTWEKTQALFEELGDREGQVRILINLSTINTDTGRYAEAQRFNEQALAISREIDLIIGQCFALLNLGLISHYQGRNEIALKQLREGLTIAEKMGSKHLQGFALSMTGHAHTALGDTAEAERVYWEAIAIWDEMAAPHLMAESLAGLARAKMAEGELEEASMHVEEMLAIMESDPQLDGAEGPIRIYLTAFEILKKCNDPRAGEVLREGNAQLNRLFEGVVNEQLRTSIEENVAAHRTLRLAAQAALSVPAAV